MRWEKAMLQFRSSVWWQRKFISHPLVRLFETPVSYCTSQRYRPYLRDVSTIVKKTYEELFTFKQPESHHFTHKREARDSSASFLLCYYDKESTDLLNRMV